MYILENCESELGRQVGDSSRAILLLVMIVHFLFNPINTEIELMC